MTYLMLLVTLETDGPLSTDIVSGNVTHAIEHMRQVEGLSADDDAGSVLRVAGVTALPDTPKHRDLANLLQRAAAVIENPESEIRSHREELAEDLSVLAGALADRAS